MKNLIDIEFLFKQHYKKLYRVAYQVVNDEAAADDIVQEVFIHIWNKKDELTISTTIEGYLVKSTVNRALNYLEKNKRVLKVEFSNQIEYDQAFGLEDSLEIDNEMFQKLINKSLDELPPKCKAIFVLSRFENMKNKEIAEHLDISIKTVENQMTIALSKLNLELKPKIRMHFPDLFLFFWIFLSLF